MSTTGLQHVALLYEDVDGMVDTVTEIADRDLAAGAAVLLCTPAEVTDRVRDRLGTVANGRFVTIPVGARYTRPIDALSMLWRTMTDLLGDGATRVNSIGEIAFTGGPDDAAWMWYEQAVGHVLRNDALTATCLYDTARTPSEVLDMACCTHAELQHGSDVGPSTAYVDSASTYPAPEVVLPERLPDARLAAGSSAADARALVARCAAALTVDVRERAQLVVTELVANAARHAGGAEAVSLWVEPTRISLCVDDAGGGIDDPYATLRPPVWTDHGRGLWLCHHAASELGLSARASGGTRAAAIVD